MGNGPAGVLFLCSLVFTLDLLLDTAPPSELHRVEKKTMGYGRQESKNYFNNHSRYKLIMPGMQRAGLISLPVKNRQLRKIDFLFQLTNLMAQFFVLRHLAFQKVVRNFRLLFDAFGRQEIQICHFIA